MIVKTIDLHPFGQQTRRIRARASAVLKKWGLIARFKRWRLTQDPETGMVVLFGVLNNSYIAAHTTMPFGNYFDPRLLQDLADELKVQVISCNSDGLRYAFILDRGQLEVLPTHVDFPFIDNGKLMARVVYGKQVKSAAPLAAEVAVVSDQTLVRLGVGAFLKVFDDIKLREENELQTAERAPVIVVIDEDEFKKRVEQNEANRTRITHIRKLFDKAVG
jgi:hypothetical protein